MTLNVLCSHAWVCCSHILSRNLLCMFQCSRSWFWFISENVNGSKFVHLSVILTTKQCLESQKRLFTSPMPQVKPNQMNVEHITNTVNTKTQCLSNTNQLVDHVKANYLLRSFKRHLRHTAEDDLDGRHVSRQTKVEFFCNHVTSFIGRIRIRTWDFLCRLCGQEVAPTQDCHFPWIRPQGLRLIKADLRHGFHMPTANIQHQSVVLESLSAVPHPFCFPP